MTSPLANDTTTIATIGAVPAMIYITSSFIANAGVSITGFGMALIFIFVYTLLDVMVDEYGYCHPDHFCNVKYAVCMQSLSLVGSMPFLLYKSDAVKHANRYLLSTLIPVTLVSTPFGQWCQDYVSSPVIRLVVGVVVTAAVGYEIYKQLRHAPPPDAAQIEPVPSTTTITTSNTTVASEQTPLFSITDSDPEKNAQQDGDPFLHGFSKRSIRIWGMVLGFLSGFLGGLIGMRGPPLMIFFLQFPFPKCEARAVGAVLLFLNMALRMAYYLVQDAQQNDPQNDQEYTRWFYWNTSWHVYLGVIVAGVMGVPIGDWIHRRLDPSKFRLALAIVLAFSGFVNIAKAVGELQQS